MRKPHGSNHCGAALCGPRDPNDKSPCSCSCSERCGPWNEWLLEREAERDEGARPTRQHVVIYTRFSPRRHADEALSCETQEAQCRDMIARRGWVERSAHRDEAVSGASELSSREGLMAAIGSLEKGDVLLVYNRDRLARDLFLAESVRRLVAQRRARIEAVEGDPLGGEDDSPEARLVRNVFDAVAQFNREANAVRTSQAMKAQQAAGKRVSRHPPFGKKVDPDNPKRLVDNPDELEAIEKVLELAAEGLKPWTIAKRMTLGGWPCRQHKWSKTTVARLLKRHGGVKK